MFANIFQVMVKNNKAFRVTVENAVSFEPHFNEIYEKKYPKVSYSFKNSKLRFRKTN